MSDRLKQQVEDNKILEITAGSHLYGTSTPESDEDFLGIFMPPAEYVLGLQTVEEVDFSIIDKDKDGKNTTEAIDRKFYEFRKFINLALKNNPNIIEILFVRDAATIYINDFGRRLLAIKNLFPSQQCIPRFIGYASSQRHKMIIKRDHFNELCNAYDFLGLCDPKLTMGQVYDQMIDCNESTKTFIKKGTAIHIHCGDLCFEPGIYAKKAIKILKERLDKATNRSELVLKHGYDTKFGSHLIRLLFEGLTLLKYGELIFPLPESELILEIKQGKWEISQVLDLAEKLEARFGEAKQKTKLPKNANFKKIEEFTINLMKEHLKQE